MKRSQLIRTFAGVVALGVLVPAVGATAADVTTSFTVTEGSAGLSMSVASGTADLGSVAASLDSAGALAGDLDATTVTDARGSLSATWAVQVEAVEAEIAHAQGDGSVPLTGARVFFDQATVDGLETTLGSALSGMAVSDAQLVDGTASLASPYSLITGTTTDLGLGEAPSVTYTPRMEVTVPAGTPTGDYSVTVRQTVS